MSKELVEQVAKAIKSIPIRVAINGKRLEVYHNDETAIDVAKAAIAAMGDVAKSVNAPAVATDQEHVGSTPAVPTSVDECRTADEYNALLDRRSQSSEISDTRTTFEEWAKSQRFILTRYSDKGDGLEPNYSSPLTRGAWSAWVYLRTTEPDKCQDCGAEMIEVCSGLESMCRESKPVTVSLAKCIDAAEDVEGLHYGVTYSDARAIAIAVLDAAGVKYAD